MGFGLKFPVLQRNWSDIISCGLYLSSDVLPPLVYNIFIADNTADAIPYYECDFRSPFIIVIGSESIGISEEVLKYYI